VNDALNEPMMVFPDEDEIREAKKLVARASGDQVDEPRPPEHPQEEEIVVDLPVPVEGGEGTVRSVRVRGLTGKDEEHIERGSDLTEKINRTVERGIVSEDVSVDDLPVGSRDAVMLGIRRATFGSDLDLEISCRKCGDDQTVQVDLEGEIETTTSPDTTLKVDLRGGVALLRWPTVGDERAVLEAAKTRGKAFTTADANTLIIANVVLEIDGNPFLGLDQARAMPMADRKKLVRRLSDAPGPKLGDVKHTCPQCGITSPLPIGYWELFR
jgi:hypothetical protein